MISPRFTASIAGDDEAERRLASQQVAAVAPTETGIVWRTDFAAKGVGNDVADATLYAVKRAWRIEQDPEKLGYVQADRMRIVTGMDVPGSGPFRPQYAMRVEVRPLNDANRTITLTSNAAATTDPTTITVTGDLSGVNPSVDSVFMSNNTTLERVRIMSITGTGPYTVQIRRAAQDAQHVVNSPAAAQAMTSGQTFTLFAGEYNDSGAHYMTSRAEVYNSTVDWHRYNQWTYIGFAECISVMPALPGGAWVENLQNKGSDGGSPPWAKGIDDSMRHRITALPFPGTPDRDLGPVVLGEWNYWVIGHFAHTDASRGRIAVWKNGITPANKIGEWSQPTVEIVDGGVDTTYGKQGGYRQSSIPHTHVFYYGDTKVGRVLSDVAPDSIGLNPPANVTLPTITGGVVEGNTLTAANGTWQGTDITYSLAWQRETSGTWANIAGATAQTYVSVTADVGHQIRVIVTATNTDGSASATSAAVGPITAAPPTDFAQDSFTGTADTLLENHVPELGTSWVRHTTSVDSIELDGSGGIRTVTGGGSGTSYYESVVPATADYEVSAEYDIESLPGTITSGVMARLATGALTGYTGRWNQATSEWQLHRVVSNSFTLLGSSAHTMTVGDTGEIKLRVSGGTPTVLEFVADGEVVISFSDPSPVTPAGRAGVRMVNNGGSPAGMVLRNFRAGPPTPDVPPIRPFSVSGFTINGPDDQPFIARGANVGVNSGIGGHTDAGGLRTAPHVTEAQQWGWNAIRIIGYVSRDTSWIGLTPASGIYGRQNAITHMGDLAQTYASAGFVVILSPMDITSGVGAATTQDLDDIEDALEQWATRFANEPRVWFNINEPDSGTVNNAATFQSFHTRFYNAIRAASSNSIYIADAMTNGQDSGTPKIYDSTMGPAFVSGKTNVVFGLHNFGSQTENLSSQATYTTTYTNYLQTCHDAGLAMVVAEFGFRHDGLDTIGALTDVQRNVRGFYATLDACAAKGVGSLFWHGTYDRVALKRDLVDSANNQPFYYEGANGNLTQAGRDYWAWLHSGVLPPEEAVTVAAQVLGATAVTNGQDVASAAIAVTVPMQPLEDAGIRVGDELVAICVQRANTTFSVVTPSGWGNESGSEPIERGVGGRVWIMRRKVDGTEPANYVWTFSNSVGQCTVAILALRGFSRLPRIEYVYNSTAAISHAAPARTATRSGTIPIGIAIAAQVTIASLPFTWAAGITPVIHHQSITYNTAQQLVAVGRMAPVAAGASASPSGTFAGATPAVMITMMLEPDPDLSTPSADNTLPFILPQRLES
jgi:hypothetical protein